MKVQCPRCPLCGRAPEMAISLEQVMCSNEDCPTLFWNSLWTLDENLTNTTDVKLPEWFK